MNVYKAINTSMGGFFHVGNLVDIHKEDTMEKSTSSRELVEKFKYLAEMRNSMNPGYAILIAKRLKNGRGWRVVNQLG